MAYAPQKGFEDAGSPAPTDDPERDIPGDRQIFANFQAHINTFAYRDDSANSISISSSQTRVDSLPMANSNRGGSKSAIKDESPASLRRSSRKRTPDDEGSEYAASSNLARKKRSTTKQRSAADPHNPVSLLVDSLRPDLMLVFIGLNPGLMTAATGHAYSHPSNMFWKLLHRSGVTPKLHHPSETHDLMDLYSIGNTNICLRPTRSGDGLSKQELLDGAGVLEEKIARHKPEAVCIVGKSIWESIYKNKTGKNLKKEDFHYGWQDAGLWLGRTLDEDGTLEWPGARTFVSTTTSGLFASMSSAQKLDVWRPLGEWVLQKRGAVVKKEEDDVKVEEEEEE